MVQLQNDLILKLSEKTKKERERKKEREGEQREMREQIGRGTEEEINYTGIIKASLLLLCPASLETKGGEQYVCNSISVQV